MKTLLSIVFCLATFCAFGQVTGDITKDTIQANQYFAEAMQLPTTQANVVKRVELLEKAAALYDAYPIMKNTIVVKTELAIVYYSEMFENKKTITLLQSIVDEAEKSTSLKNNLCVLDKTYYILSNVYGKTSREHAIVYAKKSRKCLDKTSPNYFMVSYSLIELLAYKHLDEEVDSLIQELEDIVENKIITHKPFYNIMLYKMKALYYLSINNTEQSILYLHKLFEENEKTPVMDVHDLSIHAVRLGHQYGTIGNVEEAIKWINKGKDLSVLPKDHPEYGGFYSHIGSVYRVNGQYELAIENYKLAIALRIKDSLTLASELQISYYLIGLSYAELEQYPQAIEYLKKGLNIGVNPNYYILLSRIYNEQKNYELSLQTIHKGVLSMSTQFKDTNVQQNPSIYEIFKYPLVVAITLGLKGVIWLQLGEATNDISKIEEAIKVLKKAIKFKELSWRQTQGFDKMRYDISTEMVSYLNLLLESQEILYTNESTIINFEEILTTSEKRKAIQLMETLSPSNLPKTLYEEEQRITNTIQNAGLQLDLAKQRQKEDSIQFYQNAYLEATEQLRKYRITLKEQYPKETNHFYHIKYATLQEIQHSLLEGTLFINYNIVGKRQKYDKLDKGVLIVIDKNKEKIIKTDLPNLSKNIKKFNELIQDRFAFQTPVRNEFIDVSHELYKMLIAPIESELEGKTELRIVVEGHLFNLPFELLLPTNEKKPYHELDFLIKKYEINYHYSATAMLRLMEKETVRNNSILAFAPIFSKGDKLTTATRSLNFMVDSLYRSIENFEFVALPNTKTEVNTIAKMLKAKNGQTNVLLHKNATKTNFAQQLEKQSYQFVHIATHGLVNFKNPRLSALACFSKNETMDNLMYANEIQFKSLNADLVVLSSCESGIGQLVQGEGLIALNRSFIYSGAKNVLFSLWKVNDKYSSELMIDFYKYYLDGQSYTTALRNAKLKMLANPTSAQPNFWAAFILMGQ